MFEIHASGVRDVAHHTQTFLEPLARRASLASRQVMHPRADLQEHAHERHFVAHGFEEQLLEQITGLQPVTVAEKPQRFRKPRVVFKRRKHHDFAAQPKGKLTSVLRPLLIVPLLILNLILWGTPILIGGVVKLLTFGELRHRVNRTLPWFAERFVQGCNLIFDLTLTTKWDVEGIDGLRRDGHYLVISNHVSWIDIFALIRVFYGIAPFTRFFLKSILIWSPIVGQACWALGFPFMRRYTPEYLAKHPEKRGRDLETTRVACRLYRHIPVTILNFVEGTRITPKKHAEQNSPYRHLLRPRPGGISFVLASLGEQVDAMIDVTLVYPDGRITMLDYITNRVPRIIVRGRRLDIPPEFTTSAATEPGPARERFKAWIEQVWREKDERIESLLVQSTPS